MSAPYTTKFVMIDAITTGNSDVTNDGLDGYTYASAGVQVGHRHKVSIQVVSVGTTPTCYIDVSQDNSNWTPYNRIVSNATGALAGVGSVAVNITDGDILLFPDGDHFNFVRVKALFSTPMNVSADEVTAPNITATLHALY